VRPPSIRLPRYISKLTCRSFQRGVYPAEDFTAVKKYGLNMLVSSDDQVRAYIKKIMSQLDKWMIGGKISKLVIVITDKDTGEHVERWQFDVRAFPIPSHSPIPQVKALTIHFVVLDRSKSSPNPNPNPPSPKPPPAQPRPTNKKTRLRPSNHKKKKKKPKPRSRPR
jgi:mitotic spindle assembly checkpoint protein MAD2